MLNKFPILKSLKHSGLLAAMLLTVGLIGCTGDKPEIVGNCSSTSSSSANYISFADLDVATRSVKRVKFDAEGLSIPVAVKLDEAASEDVTFTIIVDRDVYTWYKETYGTMFEMLPENCYEHTIKLTIPAGETRADLDFTLNRFPSDMSTTEYVLPFRIVDVAGPARIKNNDATDGHMSSDRIIYSFSKKIFFVMTGVHKQSVKGGSTLTFTVRSEDVLTEDVSLKVKPADAAYYERYGGGCTAIPAGDYTLTPDVTIKAGETTGTVEVQINNFPSDTDNVAMILIIDPESITDTENYGVRELVYNNGAESAQTFETYYLASLADKIVLDASVLEASVDAGVTAFVNLHLNGRLNEELAVTLKPADELIAAYNAEHDTNYVAFPADKYIVSDAVIPANTKSEAVEIYFNEKPDEDNDYAIALQINTVGNSEVEIDADNNWVILLLTSGAKQLTPIFSGFTAANQTAGSASVGKTLRSWTIEYWVKHDDYSNINSSSLNWLSASGTAEWRKRVYSPQSVPVNLPTQIAFLFWPQGDQDVGPMMQFTASQILSASSKNGGYVWRPDLWAHLAITYDNGTLRFYINGVQQQFGANCSGGVQTLRGWEETYNNATGWSTITIAKSGANATYAKYYHLELAQLRLWNKAMSAEEIKTNMGRYINPDKTGAYPAELEGYWPMDEGEGSVLKDVVGGHNITCTASRISWTAEESDFSKLGKE